MLLPQNQYFCAVKHSFPPRPSPQPPDRRRKDDVGALRRATPVEAPETGRPYAPEVCDRFHSSDGLSKHNVTKSRRGVHRSGCAPVGTIDRSGCGTGRDLPPTADGRRVIAARPSRRSTLVRGDRRSVPTAFVNAPRSSPRKLHQPRPSQCRSARCIAAAAIAASPIATVIWFSPCSTSPAAYSPSMLVCRRRSVTR